MLDNELTMVPTGSLDLPKPKSGEWEIMTCVGQIWGRNKPSWLYQISDQPPQLRIRTLESIPPEELPKKIQKAIKKGYGVGINEADCFVIYRKTP